MVEFKPGMKKEELLAIAAANGITADDSMTKAEIIDALNAHNAQEAAGTPTEGAAEGAELFQRVKKHLRSPPFPGPW